MKKKMIIIKVGNLTLKGDSASEQEQLSRGNSTFKKPWKFWDLTFKLSLKCGSPLKALLWRRGSTEFHVTHCVYLSVFMTVYRYPSIHLTLLFQWVSTPSPRQPGFFFRRHFVSVLVYVRLSNIDLISGFVIGVIRSCALANQRSLFPGHVIGRRPCACQSTWLSRFSLALQP